tara:strand:+ start:538 stop:993 length:456 start_codon:yes stop_codon:yes gene_type:complete
MNKVEFYYVTLIDAAREKVWEALTNGEFTKQYWHMTEVQSDWAVGDTVVFMVGDEVGCEGEVLVADAPRSLSYTWHFPGNPACAAEAPSRVLFSLEEIEGITKLTVRHDKFSSESSPTYQMVSPGWPFVLAGLKTLCETGKTVDFSALKIT